MTLGESLLVVVSSVSALSFLVLLLVRREKRLIENIHDN